MHFHELAPAIAMCLDILAERAAGRVKTSIACGYQLSLRA
jgi:hypothetical protein